jgi:hypothetical protein
MVAMTVSMLTTPRPLTRWLPPHQDGTMVLLMVGGIWAGARFPLVLAARVARGWPPAWCSPFPPS